MKSEKFFIVVIDDDLAVRETFRMLLEMFGFEVLAATSATDALSALRTSKKTPAAIIADFRLADGETGSEAIRLIQEAAGAAVPGIIVTGDTSPERIQKTLASGFKILHKPVLPETLKREIESAIDLAR